MGKFASSETIDAPPGSQPQAAGQELEDVDRGGVGDGHLVGRGSDQGCDEPGHPAREVDPAVRVPAPDEVPSPLALDDLAEALHGPAGQGAERVAVEVDDAFGQDELLAQGGELVRGIERLGVGTGEDRGPGHRGDVTAPRPAPGGRDARLRE